MKKWVFVVFALCALCAVCAAGDDGRIDLYSDGMRIGSDGTKINLLCAGVATITAGSTSVSVTSVTLPSVASGDIAVVTANAAFTSATLVSATCGTQSLTISINTAEPSDRSFNWVVIGKP